MPVVGVEDGSFLKGITRRALLVAVLFKDLQIKDVKFKKILVDGFDATQKLAEILGKWKFEVVFLAGVSFAGFNLIDPIVIHEKFGKPVVVVTKTKPNTKAIKRALQKHFKDWKMRLEVFEKLDTFHKHIILIGKSQVYVKIIGIDAKRAYNLIQALSFLGKIPEPVRVARLIARGLS